MDRAAPSREPAPARLTRAERGALRGLSRSFSARRGLGRIGASGAFVGFVIGFASTALLWAANNVVSGASAPAAAAAAGEAGSPPSLQRSPWLALRGATYVVLLGAFHLLEFLSTAAGQPLRVTAESFLLSHSIA
jgi:protein-S-isoprenylcysteine O-methyltransferase